MAVSGFKGFGWILCGVILSPGFYLVSSKVAAERGRLEAVDRAIVGARHDIRALETEFETRSNFAQLERWNGDVLALSAPRPEQYASGDASLASLRMPDLGDAKVQTAALIVPSAPAPAPAPALTPAPAPASALAQAPASIAPTRVAAATPMTKVVAPVPARETSRDRQATQVRTATAVRVPSATPTLTRPTLAVSSPVATAAVAPRRPVAARPQAVAMLDSGMTRGKLLDERTLGDLASSARAEARRR